MAKRYRAARDRASVLQRTENRCISWLQPIGLDPGTRDAIHMGRTRNPKGVGIMTTMVGTATGGWGRIGHGTTETLEHVSVGRNLLLLLAAPWIGLAYIVAFPFVGVAALVKALLLGR